VTLDIAKTLLTENNLNAFELPSEGVIRVRRKWANQMIDVTCQCGHVSHSEEQHIGKHLRCPNCGEPVPILHAARAMVQPPTASPRTQTNQPRISRVRRFRSPYAVAAAIGVMVLAGLWLVVHFQSRGNEDSKGTPSVSDTGKAAPSQKQASGSQSSDGEDQSVKWEVIDSAPIPSKPKGTPSSARRSQRHPAATDETAVDQNHSPFEQGPSLPNGARIAPDIGTDGYGELNVNNGSAEDARIILYSGERDEKTRDQNVTAHNSLQITGIPVGTYELKYALGSSFYQFDRSLDYTEQRTEEADRVGVFYKEISVTLHPVVGGNARTKKISRDDFLKGRPPRPIH
jgi:hypothetical protein